MAQAVMHDEVELESLLAQAKEIALLHQTDDDDLQMMVGAPMAGALMAAPKAHGKKTRDYVPAGELKYANPDGWKITPLCALLNRSHELRVNGEYQTKKLKKSSLEVSFEVMVKGSCEIKEVELILTPPSGSVVKRTESLNKYPRGEPISLKLSTGPQSGIIKFELKGTECETLKKGLVIFGVVIKAIA